jgi:hypothetical protein
MSGISTNLVPVEKRKLLIRIDVRRFRLVGQTSGPAIWVAPDDIDLAAGS